MSRYIDDCPDRYRNEKEWEEDKEDIWSKNQTDEHEARYTSTEDRLQQSPTGVWFVGSMLLQSMINRTFNASYPRPGLNAA